MFEERVLVKCVRDFLTPRVKVEGRLLLALSGGSDSLALLLLLLECQKKLAFTLELAHVDHAFRPESSKEAVALEHLAKKLQLTFHLRKLKPYQGSNVEDHFREKRYSFFKELHEKNSYQAVLLAHHGDDQGETVLKRLCEGARLGALGGLKPETKRGELSLWRPLLPLRKKVLQTYLEKKGSPFFDDASNRDTTYLRARMRQILFPTLEKQFGKNIGKNFCRLSHLFQDVATYLHEKKERLEQKMVTGPFGSYLENPKGYPRLEMRFFVEEWARCQKVHLSQDEAENLLHLIDLEAANGSILASPASFIVSRQHLFLLQRPFPSFSLSLWKGDVKAQNWKDFWKGLVPPSFHRHPLFFLKELEPPLLKKIKKHYSQQKVPSFFYDKAPLVLLPDGQLKECLTEAKKGWRKDPRSSKI